MSDIYWTTLILVFHLLNLKAMDAEQYLFFLFKKLFHTVFWIKEQTLHSYWCCWQWQSQKANERSGADVGQTGLGLGSNPPPWGKSLSIYGSVLGHNRRLLAHPERNRQIWVTRVLIQEPFRHQHHLARTETQTIHYLTGRGQCLLKLELLTPSLLPLGHKWTKRFWICSWCPFLWWPALEIVSDVNLLLFSWYVVPVCRKRLWGP